MELKFYICHDTIFEKGARLQYDTTAYRHRLPVPGILNKHNLILRNGAVVQLLKFNSIEGIWAMY